MDELAQDKDTSLETGAKVHVADSGAPMLKAAIRQARVEEAERSDVLALLRGAEIARLEMLQDALQPVLAQVPPDADIFDAGLMPAAHPRLFIDMIGFIEMGRDRRLYRFVQDTKHGRVSLAESEKIDVMVKAVTDYIARRLVEREKALAADMLDTDRPLTKPKVRISAASPASPPKPRPLFQGFNRLLGFTIELLGSMLLFTLIAAGCYHFFTLVSSWPPHFLNR